MSTDEHQVNLFARYEQRLLSGNTSRPKEIPAVIITGFLGSGKTTLVHHILRNRGALRIAVLINEVGQLDVDSKLVNVKQGNAALGLPAVDLSGGCVCCSRAEDLTEALRMLRAPPAAAAASPALSCSTTATCDYLLVETSGAADAGPLAEALVAAGFRLDAVVAMVDAEAGREALQHPVAQAQVCCADVVVLNKCDLLVPASGLGSGGQVGGLGALADMEDLLAEMAPGVRVVRARYGEVPLTTVLDVEPVDAHGGSGSDKASAMTADTAAVAGGGGFMSHESVPGGSGAIGTGSYRLASGPLTADGMAVGSSRHAKRRVRGGDATSTSSHPHPHPHGHHHHQHGNPGHLAHEASATSSTLDSTGAVRGHGDHVHGQDAHADHARLHSAFHTESLTVAERPCSLVAFGKFATAYLVKDSALLRSKGVMWFGERRGHRFTFHLSGRRRLELAQEGPWEGQPASHLVLIGTDAAAMRRLREAFLADVASGTILKAPVWLLVRGSEGNWTRNGERSGAAGTPRTVTELEAAAMYIAGQERLELLGCESWEAPAAAAATGMGMVGPDCGGGDGCAKELECGAAVLAVSGSIPKAGGRAGGECSGGLLHFTTRGSALHGINAEEINAELIRRSNASGRLLLVAATASGRISAVTNVQSRDRVVSLLLPCQEPEAQQQARLCVEGYAEPLLRKAYAHAHNCKCDVAAAMKAFHD